MTLPPGWTSPLRTAPEVREADRRAIEDHGIAGIELMERAATGLADAVMRQVPYGLITVLCGKGNNGGDGLAAARILRTAGREVEILSTCDPGEWVGDPAEMLDRLGDGGPARFAGTIAGDPSCVVDCLLGTGASGPPRGEVAAAVAAITGERERGAVVIACDVPSGVDASTGEVAGAAVTADLTVTFHALKVGLKVRPGKDHSGRVELVEIGIPGEDGPWSHGLIGDWVVDGLAVRESGDDKFAAGVVIVVGGSPGLTGAPLLAASGAARGGAGYVTVALPGSLLSASDELPEVMGLALPESDGSHCEDGAGAIGDRSARAGAVVVGPGLGRSPDAVAFASAVVRAVSCPLVLDADGLNAFAGRAGDLTAVEVPLVLTPHEAELAALLGVERGEVSSHRLASVRSAAGLTGAVVVLKGDDTLIAEPGGDLLVSPGGAPALATAGSGDVLAGLTGALLSRGAEPVHAAAAAVRIHLESGRIAARHGAEGVIAGDIARLLPEARERLTGAVDGR